ncbi:transmembrane protein fend-like isoform X2 [Bradysia coprophila]|uniref:transmembrane protein fend-like isoform X2 n=1 Tax=Bradysia coprophila TaxID=38358 RepID=UPI00187DAF71|nr:transmembrane protein fend-like isoform X2 [Bradysia coprophila]
MCWKVAVTVLSLFGLSGARSSGLYSEESPSSIRLEQCHDGCIKKFATDDISCLQAAQCSMCWDDCTVSTSINKSILATWSLGVTSMVRENSLVSANIAWESQNSPSDCLVTWEVSGGGLIGNLLTQSSNVELSLWPDTKYRVQVTCKNKRTEEISRSLPLTLDTGLALVMVRVPTAQPNKSREITVLDDAKIFTTYLLVDQPIESPFSFESLYDSNKEFVIGSLIVACICIVFLLAYIISKRKSSATDKLPLIDTDDVSINCDEVMKQNRQNKQKNGF